MTKEELLIKIREDRPNQVINEVINFNLNDFGFYDVDVDMQVQFFETRILHHKMTIPYPLQSYLNLTPEQSQLLYKRYFNYGYFKR